MRTESRRADSTHQAEMNGLTPLLDLRRPSRRQTDKRCDSKECCRTSDYDFAANPELLNGNPRIDLEHTGVFPK